MKPLHRFLDRRGLLTMWRRLALGLFLFGCGGTAAELLLLEHFEDPWQWTPIVLLGLGIVAGALLALRATRRRLRVFQLLMGLYLCAGGLGVYLHLKSNMEFEMEMNPAVGGFDLIVKVFMGAMPALAPGQMMQMGLLGFLIALGHPALASSESPDKGE
ncbi:hypothetical protein [Candidatus Palauibacter sp.]|uniref:hypothetical protein n=1 Tax=Candidatus Palauibacter sp. TaxID=3101350 RepID=UPI003B018B29